MVEKEKVRRLLQILLDNLSDLDRYRMAFSLSQLNRDRDIQHQVLHALYLTIQSGIDIALHILSDAGLPAAKTYADAFRALGSSGHLDEGLAERLAAWASLRNVIAHSYPTVDFARVHGALANELDDWEVFAANVAVLVGAQGGSRGPGR